MRFNSTTAVPLAMLLLSQSRHGSGQTDDEIYLRWVAAHGVMILSGALVPGAGKFKAND
jgi:hypothetical protein